MLTALSKKMDSAFVSVMIWLKGKLGYRLSLEGKCVLQQTNAGR